MSEQPPTHDSEDRSNIESEPLVQEHSPREKNVIRKDAPEGERGEAPPSRWLYFHGFGSGPHSTKAAFFRGKFKALNIPFDVPNLVVPDFEHLTMTDMLGAVDKVFREIGEKEKVGIIGSSLGAIVAMWTAARHPNVRRLLLLAPAFGLFRKTFLGLGRSGMKAWEKKGYTFLDYYAVGEKRRISADFMHDAVRYDESKLRLRLPVTIVHGSRDEVIDPVLSSEYARKKKGVKLRLVDDDHSLLLSTTEIWDLLWQDIRPRGKQ